VDTETLVSERSVGWLESPFAGGSRPLEAEDRAGWTEVPAASNESPFAEGLAFAGEAELDRLAAQSLASDLEDEDFNEALEALVDAASAKHLAAAASWSSESEAYSLASNEVEAWMSSLSGEVDRLLEQLADHFGDRSPASLAEDEVEVIGQQLLASTTGLDAATEQFLGGVIKKAAKLAKGVAKIAARGLGALIPTGKLFGLLGKLIRPLLRQVLKRAINKLPPQLRGPASALAAKGGFESEGEAGAAGEIDREVSGSLEFDSTLAEAALAPESTADRIVSEQESIAAEESPDVVGALDAGRARLVQELQQLQPGESPVQQVEQFIPIVMAAMPFIRMGIKVIGRERVKRFLADRLADLVKGFVGQPAARALAGPIVDVGLRMLSLEAGAPSEIGAEALVSTMEDTIRAVVELPAESLEVDSRLEAEIQEAFAEAAARHLPSEVLRPNLASKETEDEAGVWILMPRAARPAYRYRKYSNVFRLPIGRPLARAIVLGEGETLEEQLVDAGASEWPVQAEVELFEAIPGTQLGHLAAFEEEAQASDFEELTPQTAALLTRQPGFGRLRITGASPRRPFPGQRFYRLRFRRLRLARHTSMSVHADLTAAQPTVRVHLRFSEVLALKLSSVLAQRGNVQVVALIRSRFGPARRARLATVLVNQLGPSVTPARGQALANHMAEAMIATLAKELPHAAASLTSAVRDPARGVTLSFAFMFPTKQTIASGMPAAPQLTIRPGWHRD
jgi:hypothetical protein